MFEVLLFAAVLISIAQLWSKMTQVERRLKEMELGARTSVFAVPEPSPMQMAAARPDVRQPRHRPRERLEFEPEAPFPNLQEGALFPCGTTGS
jgi:hypothetical protein